MFDLTESGIKPQTSSTKSDVFDYCAYRAIKHAKGFFFSQHTFCFQLAPASTPSASSFIVSARTGNLISLPGQPHHFALDAYNNNVLRHPEDSNTDVHELCVVCGDRASGKLPAKVIKVIYTQFV